MEQVPPVSNVTVNPLTEQIVAVREVNTTANPDVAVAFKLT